MDSLIVKPEYRGHGIGDKLLAFAEDNMKKHVDFISIGVPEKSMLDNILATREYKVLETVYIKEMK